MHQNAAYIYILVVYLIDIHALRRPAALLLVSWPLSLQLCCPPQPCQHLISWRSVMAILHEERTLDLHADSAEWCPQPGSQDYLAVGTYQLDEASNQRHGR